MKILAGKLVLTAKAKIKKMKKYLLSSLAVAAFVSLVVLGIFFVQEKKTDQEIQSVVAPKEEVGEARTLIRVSKPAIDSEIDSPVEIVGEARGTWFFEASFPIRLVDAEGNTLGRAIAMAQADWMTEKFVPFKATLTFNPRVSQGGQIILEKDNPSGLPEHDDSFVVPVRFSQAKTTTVKVFFGQEQDGENTDCGAVSARERTIPKIPAVGRAALEQLLLGPTAEELAQGYSTAINVGVKVQTFSIQHGVAFADFDEQLGKNVGGACRVAAIRAQIIETLKQFPTVAEVVIFINGQEEDVLQP